MYKMNAICIHSNDVGQINYDTLSNGKITDIIMMTANWNDNYTLNMLMSTSQITTLLTSAHAKKIRVHAWTIRWFDASTLSISTSAQRTSCINAIVALMNTNYGGQYFDGHNDDLSERYSGTWQNYADYLSSLTTSIHNLGKGQMNSTDLLCWYGFDIKGVYPLIQCDFIIPMMYGGESASTSAWDQAGMQTAASTVFTYSKVPLVLGIYYDKRIGPYTPAQELTYLGNVNVSNSKFNGYMIYCGDQSGWSNADWASWNNWSVKNMVSNGGEINMVNVTFNGSVKDKTDNTALSGAIGVMTITLPNSTTETINLTSDASGNFTATKQYTTTGNYSASAKFTLTGYNAATSNTVNFTVTAVVKDMVVTLNVAMA
jgi:hypothetical protein